jgi:hypothetical protein
MFANAVSMAACRANLGEVMTAPARTNALLRLPENLWRVQKQSLR